MLRWLGQKIKTLHTAWTLHATWSRESGRPVAIPRRNGRNPVSLCGCESLTQSGISQIDPVDDNSENLRRTG